jgi:hypothetical protein
LIHFDLLCTIIFAAEHPHATEDLSALQWKNTFAFCINARPTNPDSAITPRSQRWVQSSVVLTPKKRNNQTILARLLNYIRIMQKPFLYKQTILVLLALVLGCDG